ncbi:MAG: PKD domain-containing protein, partial [Methanomicrobiales archaeon]|nr:PKD domain-containing protein [Methanomicrobiales archaeon]
MFGDAYFTATPSNGVAPLTVSFADLSVLPDPLAFIYTWDFGDGTFSSDKSPVHEYSAFGEYLVTLNLTSTDPSYQSSEYTLPERIRVYPSSPQARFTWVADQNYVPMKVRFIDQSYSYVAITDWNWTFTVNGTQIANSTDQNPEIQFEFDDIQTFPSHITAELTITDENGETFSVTQNVEVSARLFPLAGFAVVPSNSPGTVTFIDQALVDPIIAGDAPLRYQWEWDFGDESPTTVALYFNQNLEHTYDEPGTYLVTQTVRLMDESLERIIRENTANMYVIVSDSSVPKAAFTWVADQEHVPSKVRFIDQSYSHVAITDWNWTFTANGLQIANSTDQNPEIQFEFDDSRTFPSHISTKLTITDADGETFSVTHNVEISARLFPLAGFAFVHSNPPGTVTFIDQSLVDPIIAGASPLRYQWEWDFG